MHQINKITAWQVPQIFIFENYLQQIKQHLKLDKLAAISYPTANKTTACNLSPCKTRTRVLIRYQSVEVRGGLDESKGVTIANNGIFYHFTIVSVSLQAPCMSQSLWSFPITKCLNFTTYYFGMKVSIFCYKGFQGICSKPETTALSIFT